MAIALDLEVVEDDLAVSLAHAVAVANKRASELGVNFEQSIITITQMTESELGWRVNYSPQDYIGQQGDDLIVDVYATDASIGQVRRGQ